MILNDVTDRHTGTSRNRVPKTIMKVKYYVVGCAKILGLQQIREYKSIQRIQDARKRPNSFRLSNFTQGMD